MPIRAGMPHRLPCLLNDPPPAAGRLWLRTRACSTGPALRSPSARPSWSRTGGSRASGTGDGRRARGRARDRRSGGACCMPGLIDAHLHRHARAAHSAPPTRRPRRPTRCRRALRRAGPARAAAHGLHHRARRRLLRRRGRRGAPGDALRRIPRPARADLRPDRVGDRARAAASSRACTARPTARTSPPRGARAAAARRRLHQGHDDRRALGRARGPRPRPAHRRPRSRTLVEESHRMGYRVAAHAEGLAAPSSRSSTASTRSSTACTCTGGPNCSSGWRASGQILVPTLSCFYGVAGVRATRAASPAAETWSPLLVELAEYNLEQADLTLAAARAAGVRIAMGFDWAPLGGNAIELVRMVRHGPQRARGACLGDRDRGRARSGSTTTSARSSPAGWPTCCRRRRPARASGRTARAREHLARAALGKPVAGTSLERDPAQPTAEKL